MLKLFVIPVRRRGRSRCRSRSTPRSRSQLAWMRQACPTGTAVVGMQRSSQVRGPRCRSHLGPADPFIVGIRHITRPRGSAGVSNVASFPSFRRVRPGDALVTVTSRSRPCATPNKAEASLNQDVSCSTPSSNPSASFITENRIHVAVSSMRQVTLQGWDILFSDLSGPHHLVCYLHMHAHLHIQPPACPSFSQPYGSCHRLRSFGVLSYKDNGFLNETSLCVIP